MKKERPTEYTTMPNIAGTVSILRLSPDGQTRNPIATVDVDHYDCVLNAIKKFDGFETNEPS